jgi:hypothetical protein
MPEPVTHMTLIQHNATGPCPEVPKFHEYKIIMHALNRQEIMYITFKMLG